MTDTHWEEIAHTADVAIRVWGKDLAALFTHAAEATVSLMGENLNPPGEPFTQEVTLSADDDETLLVDWLTEILILAEEGVQVQSTEVARIEAHTLHATLHGHSGAYFSNHIKAVTYNGLEITHTSRGVETRIVYDV
jgi:SHS2 domain-containing protein